MAFAARLVIMSAFRGLFSAGPSGSRAGEYTAADVGQGAVVDPGVLVAQCKRAGVKGADAVKMVMAYYGAVQAASRVASAAHSLGASEASGSAASSRPSFDSVGSRGWAGSRTRFPSPSVAAKSVLSLRSWRSGSAASSVTSLLEDSADVARRFADKEGRIRELGEGFCYVRGLRLASLERAVDALGPYPKFTDFAALPADWFESDAVLGKLRVDVDQDTVVRLHVKPWGKPGSTTLKSLAMSVTDRSRGLPQVFGDAPLRGAAFVNGACTIGGLPLSTRTFRGSDGSKFSSAAGAQVSGGVGGSSVGGHPGFHLRSGLSGDGSGELMLSGVAHRAGIHTDVFPVRAVDSVFLPHAHRDFRPGLCSGQGTVSFSPCSLAAVKVRFPGEARVVYKGGTVESLQSGQVVVFDDVVTITYTQGLTVAACDAPYMSAVANVHNRSGEIPFVRAR